MTTTLSRTIRRLNPRSCAPLHVDARYWLRSAWITTSGIVLDALWACRTPGMRRRELEATAARFDMAPDELARMRRESKRAAR